VLVRVPMHAPHELPSHVRVPTEQVTWLPDVCTTSPHATESPTVVHGQPVAGLMHASPVVAERVFPPPPPWSTRSFPEPQPWSPRAPTRAHRMATASRRMGLGIVRLRFPRVGANSPTSVKEQRTCPRALRANRGFHGPSLHDSPRKACKKMGDDKSLRSRAADLSGSGRSPSGHAADLSGSGRSPSGHAADLSGSGRSPSGHAADLSGSGRSPSGHAADLSGSGRSPSGHAADLFYCAAA
jgi:hypothetical protein